MAAQIFGLALLVGVVCVVWGLLSLVMKKVKPAGRRPSRPGPMAASANEMAQNFQALAVPTIIAGVIITLVGLIGLLASR